MKERIGVIDLGTNTFNLLIVDKSASDFDKILSAKDGVGLGLGGINEGYLADDAMERGLIALKAFLKSCEEHHVVRVKAFATSAIRDAKNGHDFVSKVKAELDLEVEVITGEREAELIYQGVKIGYQFDKPAVIMDIGGGSTEFIFADNKKVFKSHSFNIGTARIFQLFKFQDPYTAQDVQNVVNYLNKGVGDFFDSIEAKVLVGASGSFETFYALLYGKEYPENEFENISVVDVLPILNQIIFSTYEERMQNELIIPIRKKMAPIAAIKIKWVLEKLNCNTLTISPYAMKEGVIELV